MLCVLACFGGCGQQAAGNPSIRYTYEAFVPSDVKSQFFSSGGSSPHWEQYLQGTYANDVIHSSGVHLSTERKAVSVSDDTIVIRVYLGIEENAVDSALLTTPGDVRLTLSYYGTDKENAKKIQLDGITENSDYFVDLEGKIGFVTKDLLKKHVDITLTRDDFPEFFADASNRDLDFYDTTLTVELSMKLLGKADEIRTSLIFEYSHNEDGITLCMPCYSEDDEAFAKELIASMYYNGWYLYPRGAELAFSASAEAPSDGRKYQTIPFLRINYTTKPDLSNMDPRYMLGRIMLITSHDGNELYASAAIVNAHFGFSEEYLNTMKDGGYSARLVVGNTVIREIDDIYTNPKYILDMDKLSELYYFDSESVDSYYNAITYHDIGHAEAITIPDELFTGTSGEVYITVQFYKGDEIEPRSASYMATVRYIANGDYVLIIPTFEYHIEKYKEEC